MATTSTPTSITQTQYGFAPEVAPYAQDVLGTAQALTSYDTNPYQAYTGDQVAGFSPLQQQSYDYAQQLTSSPQLQDATALAGQAGLGALNTQYTYQPSNFTADTAKSLMNPYLDVMDQATRRNAAISQQAQQAQAANAGAFGGGRDAIMRAQANAELQRNLGQNQYNAFNQAQQQYNTQQQQNANQQQFGASLGMQGLGLANTAANTLGSLGQTQYAQNVGTIGLQNQMGLQQQQQAQNVLNTQYQNFLNEQNDPYKRLGFYSDIVRGAPLMQTGSSVYAQGPSAIQNLSSLGLGAYGLSSLFGSPTKTSAKGGLQTSFADGGSVMSPGFKRYAVDHIDPRQLQLAQRNAMARGDIDTAQYSQEQMAEDAALRKGIAGALPQGADVVRAAGGGILAFAAGGSKAPTAADLVKQSTDFSFAPEDQEAENQSIKKRQEGLTALLGTSEVDPLMQEDVAQRQANIAEMDPKYAGLTALRMAAALQKSGVNDSDRWGGAFGAAAEGGEKAMAAKAAAQNELSKAKIAGATARQARKDGITGKAIEAENAAKAHIYKAQELSQQAAIHGAQTLGQLESTRMHVAAQMAAANKPGETERMMAERNAILSGKSSYNGLTGEKGAAAYDEALGSIGAARYGAKYTGQDKSFEHAKMISESLMKGPNGLVATKLANQISQLADKTDSTSVAKRAQLQSQLEDLQKQEAAKFPQKGVAAPTGGSQMPTIKRGQVMQGYRFMGGNPADKSNWEQVE